MNIKKREVGVVFTANVQLSQGCSFIRIQIDQVL